ncbi:MAG: hypothetical protein ACOCTG_03930 [Bacteroidota bacterium]
MHEDGWVIPGCPVNGPSLDAHGETIAAVWFTAEGDSPRVLSAISTNGGDSFSSPIRLDGGRPLGRVDIEALSDGRFAIVWLEDASDRAHLMLTRMDRSGNASSAISIGETGNGRSSGFPRMTSAGDDVYVTYVDTASDEESVIRTLRISAQ